MPMEPDQNEPESIPLESIPPGFRPLTQAEYDRLKFGLSRRAPKALTEAEKDALERLQKLNMKDALVWLEGLRGTTTALQIGKQNQLRELRMKLRERDGELAEVRQELATLRKKFLLMAAVLATVFLLPIFGAPHSQFLRKTICMLSFLYPVCFLLLLVSGLGP